MNDGRLFTLVALLGITAASALRGSRGVVRRGRAPDLVWEPGVERFSLVTHLSSGGKYVIWRMGLGKYAARYEDEKSTRYLVDEHGTWLFFETPAEAQAAVAKDLAETRRRVADFNAWAANP